MTPPDDKAELRRRALARRDALDIALRQMASERAAAHVLDLLATTPPAIVSGFLPIRSEIDARPAMAALAMRGHLLALPCVTPEGLVFRLWRPGDALRKAGFGLSEPEAAAQLSIPASCWSPSPPSTGAATASATARGTTTGPSPG